MLSIDVLVKEVMKDECSENSEPKTSTVGSNRYICVSLDDYAAAYMQQMCLAAVIQKMWNENGLIRMLTAIGLYTNNMMKHLFGTPARDEWLRMPFFHAEKYEKRLRIPWKSRFFWQPWALERPFQIFSELLIQDERKKCHSFQWLQLETEPIYDVKVIFNNRKMSDKLNDLCFVNRIGKYWLTAIIINN